MRQREWSTQEKIRIDQKPLSGELAQLFLEMAATQSALNRFTPWTLGEPVWKISPLASPDVVSFLQLFFVLGGLILSIIAGYRLAWHHRDSERISAKVLIPFILVAFSLTLVNLYLLDQPMGARYGM